MKLGFAKVSNNVITNNGFSIHATNFSDFENGVKQKLRIETQNPNQVPEPATLLLLGVGAVGLFGAASRRRTRF